MKNYAVAVALTLTASLLSACNSSTTPSPVPTLGPTCSLPSGVQTVLVYPAPGSTVASANLTQIVIGSTTALDPNRFQAVITDAVNPVPFYLYPGPGGPPWLQTATPPFPNPNQAPSFANPQYQTTPLNAPFAVNQVVTVYINDTKSGDNCTPLSIGSFATQ